MGHARPGSSPGFGTIRVAGGLAGVSVNPLLIFGYLVSASDNSFGTAGLSVNCIPAIIRITDVTSERNFP